VKGDVMTKSKATAPRLMAVAWLIFGFVLFAAIVRMEAAPRGGGAAAQAEANRVPVNADDIGGVVTSSKGPEAGVWVIAETTGFPVKFRKIVVTDDRGAICCLNCATRITRFGCGVWAWWIRSR
jgi:hypothetical protein